MADIKKIKVGNTTYDIRDATAARSNHTHGEATLTWGGKNFSDSYGCIDAAMVPELGANRLAFMPAAAVTVEYSRDGGATWTDYGATDSQKINLFNGNGSSFTIGKATSGAGNIATNQYQLRVNIYTGAGRVYTVLNKFVIYLSTSGTNNNWCTIRARKQSDYTANKDTWTTFADKIGVSGWAGYNVINTSGLTTYGNTATTQYGHVQFIFGCDKGSTNNSYAGLNINKIFGFGGVGWTTPSTIAKTGHMYTYDSSQNVTFPAAVAAKSFAENGTSLADKYMAKSVFDAAGDLLVGSGNDTYTRLAKGSNGTFLGVNSSGNVAWVSNPNTDTHYTNYLQIKGNGTEVVKFTQNADKTLNLKPGTNVSISAASGEITISATDTNTHNSHAIISGTKSDNSTQIKGSASSGDITLGDSGVTAGTYRSVTVNSKGIVVAGSSADADTNTWRKVQLNGTDKLGTGINTNPLNIKAGSNMTITESNGTFTFAATDTNTDTKVTAVGNHYKPANGTNLTVSSSGTASRGSTKVLTNVAIDAAGHITGGTWYTLPSSDNTDTRVTSVDNHYSPTADSGSELTAKISGTAGAYAKDREYTVLTGVKAQRDAKGHVTGITYTAQKIKDTNNTYSTVSKTSSGLCPQLPDETTATKYLRQDGMWVTPPNNDTKNTAGSSVDDTNTLYLIGANSKTDNGAVTKSNTNVYMKSNNLYAKAFYASSDRRLKENIKDLDLNCLNLVNNINLREFSWKNDKENRPTVGVIAQELKQVLPEKYMHEFIGGEETENEYLSVNDSKLVYLLIGAIQEQQKEIEELKRKIA